MSLEASQKILAILESLQEQGLLGEYCCQQFLDLKLTCARNFPTLGS